jgi:hypothetical protein
MTLEEIDSCSLGELFEFAAAQHNSKLIAAAIERAYYIGHEDGSGAEQKPTQTATPDPEHLGETDVGLSLQAIEKMARW